MPKFRMTQKFSIVETVINYDIEKPNEIIAKQNGNVIFLIPLIYDCVMMMVRNNLSDLTINNGATKIVRVF